MSWLLTSFEDRGGSAKTRPGGIGRDSGFRQSRPGCDRRRLPFTMTQRQGCDEEKKGATVSSTRALAGWLRQMIRWTREFCFGRE